MEELLFSSKENANRLRLFRLGKEWQECFVVEFMLGSDHYDSLYWGNKVYTEDDRNVISAMLIMAFLPDSHDDWQMINYVKMRKGLNLVTILDQVEDEISKRTNRI